jgi:hypothetical protein
VENRSRAAGEVGSMGAMGIRYYAYPLPEEHVRFAREEPRAFFSRDPLADAWGLAEVDPAAPEPTGADAAEPPLMLYLDKCWRELQSLLAGASIEDNRAAYDLVRGEVEMDGDWWWPYFGVLDAAQVQAVAADLNTVTEHDVDHWLSMDPLLGYGEEREYVLEFLGRAQEFTALLARQKLALIYKIG